MRILIIGASGFIGRELTLAAYLRGHSVIGLCRSPAIDDYNGQLIEWELGRSIPKSALREVDCVVHLAHDFSGLEGAQLTSLATLENIQQISKSNVSRQLFFSSYSSHIDSDSLYGQTKYKIEQAIVNESKITIVRPGLVLGNGGLFGRIQNALRFLPIIPLPNGGKELIPIIDVDKLCAETIRLIEAPELTLEANLFEPTQIMLKELVKSLALKLNKSPIILPIPSKIVFWVLKITNTLKIKLPVNEDNLVGLLCNQSIEHKSSLRKQKNNVD